MAGWGSGHRTGGVVMGHSDRSGQALHFDRDATLIVDCPACADPQKAGWLGRQCDGLREWTAHFWWVPDPDHPGFNMLAPEDEVDLRCPNCGEPGRVYAY